MVFYPFQNEFIWKRFGLGWSNLLGFKNDTEFFVFLQSARRGVLSIKKLTTPTLYGLILSARAGNSPNGLRKSPDSFWLTPRVISQMLSGLWVGSIFLNEDWYNY